jgi:diguanylate cyclase (GGDEF)-like protein
VARPRSRIDGEVLTTGFGPACGLLAAMFAGFAVLHPFALRGADGTVMASVAAVTAAAFAGAWVLARQGRVPAARTHVLAATLATLAFVNCVVHYGRTEQSSLTVNLLLVMIGTGVCLVDPRWTGALVGVFALCWLLVVGVVSGSSAAASVVLTVAMGAAVAGLANVVRLTTLHRLLQSQDELRALSQCDDLTGLLNRRGFLEAAQRSLDRGRPVRLWFLDVDGLKSINDDHGHDVGDVLLVSVAAALTDVFSGIVARLSGDEFAVLEDHGSTVGLVRARQVLDARLALASRATGLTVSVSTGTATAGPGGALSELLTAADSAMYANKQARRTIRLPLPRTAQPRVPHLEPPPFE